MVVTFFSAVYFGSSRGSDSGEHDLSRSDYNHLLNTLVKVSLPCLREPDESGVSI